MVKGGRMEEGVNDEGRIKDKRGKTMIDQDWGIREMMGTRKGWV